MALTPDSAVADGGRDAFVDFVRAVSLLVVVIWHWVFTIVVWTPTGPIASNPIGYTHGMWALTWLFQVMPLFFFVGGFAHQTVWAKVRADGGGYGRFVGGRLRKLVTPALALTATWIVLAGIATALGIERDIAVNSAVLVLSPLWFLVVYVGLVLLAPAMLALHERWGPVVVVVLAGGAGLIDVLRFRHDIDAVSYLNLLFVWGLCHQLGFFYERLVRTDRRWPATMALGGLFTLALLVYAGFYPGSMVGVPGDRVSNMAPPTLCLIALVFFQSGVAVLARPAVAARLARPRWARASDLVNRFSLPLYLFHSTGYAAALEVLKLVGKYETPVEPNATWWTQRPVFFFLPLVCTLPVIVAFSRRPAARPAPPRSP